MLLYQTKVDTKTLLLATIADSLTFIAWTKTKNGQKGQNRPQSLVDLLTGKTAERSSTKNVAFSSGVAYEKAREKILKG